MNNNLYITRSFEANDFQTTEEGRIKGYAAVFNQTTLIGGYFREVIERGAFDACDLSDVFLHVNHDTRQIPLARCRSKDSTMTITIDDKGLCIDALLDIENNSEAKAVYNSVKRGDLDGMSFAFFIEEQKWENLSSKIPTRRILKFKRVNEVSIVSRPAYKGTSVSTERSEEVANAKEELLEARKELDNSKLELEKLKLKIKYSKERY
ncbi:TPA: HK97 family phage prohead protease [Clostridium perfringens]|nr:HK97 family phage prohead protease [Clostridium perfringens]